MREALDQWTYVLAAYGVGILATLMLTAWSWIAMLRAEARLARVKQKARGE